jgi:hypothetical protein
MLRRSSPSIRVGGKAQSASGISRARTGYPPSVILIGLLLIAVAAGFTVDVFVENSHHLDVDVLGRTFTVTPGWIVIAGVVALAIFAVGASLLTRGIRKVRRRKYVMRRAESAQRERDQLARQLADERERRTEYARDQLAQQRAAEQERVAEDGKPVEENQQAAEAMPSSLD